MSLPPTFENAKDYLEECLDFFEEYQHLYKVPNIEILTQDVLNKIEVNDAEIDVFNENIDLSQTNDEFLNRFFLKLNRLSYSYENFESNELEYEIGIAVSRKKKHEIIYLANEIKNICEHADCNVVVDLGSGLCYCGADVTDRPLRSCVNSSTGYLDQQIFEITNYKVLGIECNAKHHVGAKTRQRKYHEKSIESVKHVKHTISRDSHENIETFLNNKFQNVENFCITGLHACADLSIDAVDIFLQMNQAKAIAIMPCCYHKMCVENGRFKNFPISKCLKDLLKCRESENILGVPFLRLAAHPHSVDVKLKDLVFSAFSRAILELYAQRRNCTVRRKKRKPVNTKSLDNDFDRYAETAINEGFKIIKNNDFVDESLDVEELKALWNLMAPSMYKKLGIYILLQNYLQPVIENFVLFDRLIYLQENGVINCKFQKILNAEISPRCLVLVAYKNG